MDDAFFRMNSCEYLLPPCGHWRYYRSWTALLQQLCSAGFLQKWICCSSDHTILILWESCRCCFCKVGKWLACVFTVSRHSASKLRSAKCCNDGSPYERFFHLHKWYQVLCHLSYQDHFAVIAHFCQTTSSRRSPGCSKLHSIKNGNLKCSRNVSLAFPRSDG